MNNGWTTNSGAAWPITQPEVTEQQVDERQVERNKAIPKEVIELLKADNIPQTREGVLELHNTLKAEIVKANALEMMLRKLVAELFFEAPKEGTNRVDIGQGFDLKLGNNFNYNLVTYKAGLNVVDAVDNVIDEMTKLDNEGAFIAERLFTWKVEISLKEFRKLEEDAKDSPVKAAVLKSVRRVLEIKPKAPTLEIVAAKKVGK